MRVHKLSFSVVFFWKLEKIFILITSKYHCQHFSTALLHNGLYTGSPCWARACNKFLAITAGYMHKVCTTSYHKEAIPKPELCPAQGAFGVGLGLAVYCHHRTWSLTDCTFADVGFHGRGLDGHHRNRQVGG